MSGEGKGNTTAPNRSTAISTRLWIDTVTETSATKTYSVHKAWLMDRLSARSRHTALLQLSGTRKSVTAARTWPYLLLESWCLFSLFLPCRRLFQLVYSQFRKQWRSGSKRKFFRCSLLQHWWSSSLVYHKFHLLLSSSLLTSQSLLSTLFTCTARWTAIVLYCLEPAEWKRVGLLPFLSMGKRAWLQPDLKKITSGVKNSKTKWGDSFFLAKFLWN